MCKCKNIKVGSYDNQVTLLNPFTGKYICVDRCLMDEICDLWNNGIETTGCCCGHNTVTPMINTKQECHEGMVELGYKFWINEFGVECYKPKTV